MPTALYDETFSVAYECPPPKALDCPVCDELEFSEYGRSPNVPAGWYLAPALLILPVIAAVLLF